MASQGAFKYTTKLKGARILVVGGTSGIGFCVAEAAVEHGARVIISGSNETKLSKAVDRLRASFAVLDQGLPPAEKGAPPTGTVCDLANEEALESNLESLLQFATSDGQSRLDHVVFTAGDPFEARKLQDVTAAHIARTYVVRATAPVVLAKLLVPRYIHRVPASSYTLTGGVNAEKPQDNWTVVAGFSAAVEGYARGLAVDLKPMRVNCVAPGAVHTEAFDHTPEEQRGPLLERFRQATTTGTVGCPEDLAEAYLYCMKDSFVTGSVIKSNGGRLLA
ncbi:hypothetical protein DL769_004189 [Monosporascus sp. CRB-8-3]|nr:hypothetical protein DL769_004189 [Monosporascus sp. CRB-8-3]